MRHSDVRALGIAAILMAATACVVRLDHEFDASGAIDAGVGDDAAVVSGCRMLAGVMGIASITGDVRSIALGDGVTLFVASGAQSSDGRHVDGAGFAVEGSVGADCGWSVTPLGAMIDPSPTQPDAIASPLDLVAVDTGLALYYTLYVPDASAPFGVRATGMGLAPHDATSGHFVPSGELLWAADRPAYGGSALRVGDVVYVYGCKPGGFLESDCFVARAAASGIGSAAAYSYFDGAHWSTNADDAVAVASGGSNVSVRRDPVGSRFVMTYVPPLGRTIVARTAIAPEGPWSAPMTLATCDIGAAGVDAFCAGAEQHVEITGLPAGWVAVSYDARTFATGGGTGDAFAPRLVVLPVR